MKKIITIVAAVMFSTAIFGQTQENKQDKEKKENKQNNDKDKKDNTENFTVHTTGDQGNGNPTYSNGGLNPNPPKKQEPKKESKKK